MKTAIAAAVFLATLSIAPISLVAQTTGSPAEKDFASGGKIEMTLESGDYNVRASSDKKLSCGVFSTRTSADFPLVVSFTRTPLALASFQRT